MVPSGPAKTDKYIVKLTRSFHTWVDDFFSRMSRTGEKLGSCGSLSWGRVR
jgi:hypothetical protein